MNQLVSVIIPTLQEEDYIEPLLQSIRCQTYEPIEIVISDSSPEPSKELTACIASHYNACMVDTPKKSVSHGRNQGALEAQGDILVFCDADCEMRPDFIQRLVRKLDSCVMSHGIDWVSDRQVDNVAKFFWNYALKPTSYTTGRGVAIRKEDFWAVGGYSESCDPMHGCREDLDLSARIRAMFGEQSVQMDRGAVVTTVARRPLFEQGVWEHRGYRDGVVIDRFITSTGVY